MFKNKLANASMIFFHILMCFLLLFISVFVQGNKEIFTLNKTVKNLLHHIGGFFVLFLILTRRRKKGGVETRDYGMSVKFGVL